MDVKELYVLLTANTTQFKTALAEAGAAGDAFGKGFGGMALKAAAGIGAVGLGLGAFALKAGSDLQDANRKLDTAAATAGISMAKLQPIIDLTNKKLEGFGYTNATVETGLSKLVEAHIPLSEEMATMSAAAELAAAKNVDFDTALHAVLLSAQGNTRMLKEYGVVLPPAEDSTKQLALAQTALSKAQQKLTSDLAEHHPKAQTLVKDHEAIAAATDKVARITGELNDRWQNLNPTIQALSIFNGQAEDRAKTFAGNLEILKAKFTDLAAKIGTDLLPGATKFVTWLDDSLPRVEDIQRGLARVGEGIQTVGHDVTGLVGDVQAGVGGFLGLGDGKNWGRITENISQVTGDFQHFRQEMKDGAADFGNSLAQIGTNMESASLSSNVVMAEAGTKGLSIIRQAQQEFHSLDKTGQAVYADLAQGDQTIATEFARVWTENGNNASKALDTIAQEHHQLAGIVETEQENIRRANAITEGEQINESQKLTNQLANDAWTQYNAVLATYNGDTAAALNHYAAINPAQAKFIDTQEQIAAKMGLTVEGFRGMQAAGILASNGIYKGYEHVLQIAGLTSTEIAKDVIAINAALDLAKQLPHGGEDTLGPGTNKSGQLKGGGFSGTYSPTDQAAGARAGGGPVSGGQTYLVGEKGPEMFTPLTSGNITPHGAGGVSIGNVTINVKSTDPRQAAIEIRDALLNLARGQGATSLFGANA